MDYLEHKQQDSIIIGHGFYFAQFVTEIQKRGFNGNMKRSIRNAESREFIK